MLNGLSRIFLLLTNSIRKKLVLCFMLIIIVLVSASAYTYISGKALNDLYYSSLEKQLLLNNFFVNLGSTNDLLEKYLQTGSPQDFEKYSKAYPLLVESANSLELIINNKKAVRVGVDLKYMTQSYIEEANSSIQYMRARTLDLSNEHYYSAKNILKLINGVFKDLYSIVTEDTNKTYAKINENRNTLFTFNGFLILFVGLISIVFMQWFSSSLTKPIKRLTVAAAEVSKGDMSIVEIPITTHDEVSILTIAFNKMMKKIDQQISEIKDKAEIEKKLKDEEMENLKIKNLLKESELKALQSRINPHFLFNSLNMISQMSYIEGAVQTTSLLESMADLLRYNLDKFSKVVTIEDEMGNIKDYVFIQKKRFGDRISFEISEDFQVNNCMIPCLIIQPLVENSIIHGVGFYTENGVVGVEVKKHLNRVIIRIYDNGVGIEREKLEGLREMIEIDSQEDNSNGIGLYNVCARLRNFYNNDINISIASEPNKHTEIILDLPFRQKETAYDV